MAVKRNVGGIGDSPGKGHVFHAAVFIKLGEHMLLLNNAAGFLAEENTADVEADFDADDFACPGNQNSWQQTKEGTIHCQKGNGGNTENIAEDEKPDAYQESSISEGSDVIRQTVHITGHGKMNGLVIKFGIIHTDQVKGYDSSSHQDEKSDQLFTFVNHSISFSRPKPTWCL